MKQKGSFGIAELIPKIKGILALNEGLFGDAVQRSVLYEDYQKTIQHCITRIDVLRKGELPPESTVIDYKDISLRAEILNIEQLVSRVSELNNSQFTSGTDTLRSSHNSVNFLEYGLPSNNEYAASPGTLFDISLNNVQLPMRELVHPELPYYPSPVPPIKTFLQLSRLDSQDGRLGHILLYFPNLKAQLSDLSLKKRRLGIHIKSTVPWNSLVLKINYSDEINHESETVIPSGEKEAVDLKFVPTTLNVLLLAQNGEQLDYYEDSPYHTRGGSAILRKLQSPQIPQFSLPEPLIEDVTQIPRAKLPMKAKTRNESKKSKKVFVIHGHSKGPKEAVARFLENLGLQPIVLHEKPNKGRTIIEKFEQNAKDVGFAIALLTGDDVGKARKDRKQRSRPRQNVIFEFGFFIGKLGRKCVCGLKDKDVEVPSDYDGILYIPLDENEHWKTLLARELTSAGYRLKTDKLLG